MIKEFKYRFYTFVTKVELNTKIILEKTDTKVYYTVTTDCVAGMEYSKKLIVPEAVVVYTIQNAEMVAKVAVDEKEDGKPLMTEKLIKLGFIEETLL